MFLNVRNTSFYLVKVKNFTDTIGVNHLKVISKKLGYGTLKSINSYEQQSADAINIKYDFKIIMQIVAFDGSKLIYINDQVFNVEKTYINGQFIELYLTSSDICWSDINEG